MLVSLYEPRARSLCFEAVSDGSPDKVKKRKADDMDEDTTEVGGWVYVGSHNFSSAAWVSSCASSPRGSGDLES